MAQKPDFFIETAGIARQTAALTDGAVTGNDQGNGIMPYGATDGVRILFFPRHLPQAFCQITVSRRLPVRHLAQQLPHVLAEGAAPGVSGNSDGAGRFPAK